LFAGFLLAAAAASAAPSDTSLQTLPTINVEAAPLPASPAGVSVIRKRTQLAKQNVADTADVLRYFPNLQVRQRYIGDPNAIISGRDAGTLQSARSLVYADGLLLSNLMTNGWDGAPRWGMLSPQSIESVEVLYGPYSALYPGNSIGTTVLVRTQLPDRFTAGVDAQYFSQDFHDDYGAGGRYDGSRFAAHVGDHHGRWRWLLSLGRLDSHGQPMQYATAKAGGDPADAVAVGGATLDRNINGNPRLVYGANSIEHTRQTQATLQVGVDISDSIQARFTLGGWRNHAFDATRSFLRDANGQPVYGGTIFAHGQAWTLPDSGLAPSAFDQTHVLLGAQLDGILANGWRWQAVASRFDFQHDLEHDAAAAQGSAGTLADMGGSGWDTFDLSASGPLGDNNTLYAGAHFDRYLLDSRVFDSADWRGDGENGTRIRTYGGRTQTRALYVQDVWDFAQAWTLTLGARWEQWRAYRGLLANAASSVAYPDRRRSDVSPKASLDWRFAGPWRLRLSFGKAVRYPTVEELFQGSLSNGAIVNNNPDLEPERDWSTDLDLVRDTSRGQWRVSLYQDRFADTLYSQTDITLPVPVTSVQNIDAVRMRGIEFALQRRDVLPNVDVEASVAWNDAITLRDAQYPLADGKRFPRIPRLRATLFADWRFAPGWDASLGVRGSGRQYSTLDNSDFVDTYGAVSSFTVADAKLRWRFAPQWTASLGVDNLTNERYWVYHPYAGRTWFGEVSWNIGGSKS
jgi:iron complex outermembrane receptor protein